MMITAAVWMRLLLLYSRRRGFLTATQFHALSLMMMIWSWMIIIPSSIRRSMMAMMMMVVRARMKGGERMTLTNVWRRW